MVCPASWGGMAAATCLSLLQDQAGTGGIAGGGTAAATSCSLRRDAWRCRGLASAWNQSEPGTACLHTLHFVCPAIVLLCSPLQTTQLEPPNAAQARAMPLPLYSMAHTYACACACCRPGLTGGHFCIALGLGSHPHLVSHCPFAQLTPCNNSSADAGACKQLPT